MASKFLPTDYVDSLRKNNQFNSLKTNEYFTKENYNVETFSYPSGLGQDPDLQHYVAFFINKRGKSQVEFQNFNKDFRSISPVGSGATNTRLTEEQAGVALTGTVIAAGALAAASAVAATKGGAILKKSTALEKAGAALGSAALAAGILEAAKSSPSLKPDTKRRISEVVTLHIEDRPSVKYGVNYQDKELGALTGFLAGVGSATKSIEEGLSFGGEAFARIAAEVARIPSLIPGVGSRISDLLSVSSRTKTNPFREVLFESVDYRTFNFKYRFFPKDAQESERVQNIIKLFKFHMHPELSANKFFYIYPSEFEIVYYYRNKVNNYFNRISECALTDMSVEYGGDQFATFADGAPTEVTLNLTFRELELMTKQTIKNGN
ncbi:MAG: hypothetical protein EBU90_07545 [Proteobacteria bacterium]|nr:hypothetical protein [Pseudomonadota bacterium]NBP13443.1 hypothetical protein [bacterium]